MYPNYHRPMKWVKIISLVLLPFYAICQNDNQHIKKEPIVTISLDSARLIAYNENTTPLEVVTRNILGIIEGNPSYFMEQTELAVFSAHAMKLSVDSISRFIKGTLKSDEISILDTIAKDFHKFLYLNTEFQGDYLFADSLKFNYRWIRAGEGQEAVITVNNERIYFLRKIF